MLGVVLFKIDYNPTVFPILPLWSVLTRATLSLSTLCAMMSLASPTALDIAKWQFAPEILLTIFENISDQATLRHLRLVSSQFEELVTPIWRRQVILTPELVAQYSLDKGWADHSILQIQMTVHTKHVIFKKELDWLLVNRLLSTLKNLQLLYFQPWSNISVPIINLFGSSGFGTLGTLGYLREVARNSAERCVQIWIAQQWESYRCTTTR